MLAGAALRIPLGLEPLVADVLRAVRDDARPFALVGRGRARGRSSGSEPLRVVEGAGGARRARTSRRARRRRGRSAAAGSATWATGSGAAIERLPPPPPRPVPGCRRDARVLRPRAAPGRGRRLVVRGARRERARSAAARGAARAARRGGRRVRPARRSTPAPGRAARHIAAVADCVERIAAGELFQANLCAAARGRASAGDAARRVRRAAAAAASRPRRVPRARRRRAVLSFSPELFLRRRGGVGHDLADQGHRAARRAGARGAARARPRTRPST